MSKSWIPFLGSERGGLRPLSKTDQFYQTFYCEVSLLSKYWTTPFCGSEKEVGVCDTWSNFVNALLHALLRGPHFVKILDVCDGQGPVIWACFNGAVITPARRVRGSRQIHNHGYSSYKKWSLLMTTKGVQKAPFKVSTTPFCGSSHDFF